MKRRSFQVKIGNQFKMLAGQDMKNKNTVIYEIEENWWQITSKSNLAKMMILILLS